MLFARIRVMDWMCPTCNALHVTRFKAPVKALYCDQCTNTYYPGTILYKAPKGPKPLPARDTLMIGGGFPLKREVNRIYCSGCSGEILDKTLEKMLHHDLTPIQSPIPMPRASKPYDESPAAGDWEDDLTG